MEEAGGSLLLKSHCHIKSLCTRVHFLAPCFCSPQSPGHQPSGSVKETIPSQKLSSGLDFSTSYQCIRYMYACVPLGSQSLWQTKLCHGSLGLEVLISKRRLNHCLSLGQESFRKFCFWRCHFKHGNFCCENRWSNLEGCVTAGNPSCEAALCTDKKLFICSPTSSPTSTPTFH